jgi:alpha-galactosidase
VAFHDATDRHNTLVQEQTLLPYRTEETLSGNVLFVDALLEKGGLFVLKEAPGGHAHLHYPGYDFTCRIGEIRAVGTGVAPQDLRSDRWTHAYGAVTGVTDGSALGRMRALRTYQSQLRLRHADRDEMIMMNTWGDRGQDTRLRESFALDELEAGARLGISHLQLDDGWQSGRSSNSAFEGGSLEHIWDNPEYWTPHPDRFPHGLGPVVERGRELGIEVCLWYNPSRDDAYAHWRNDADTLIRLYREYGIRTFKIDGVQVESKQAESNLRQMFEVVRDATGDTAVFNLDVTAGKRYGYHTFNVYGNLFLENRYTDWMNYYPHWTLRNLWMLSRYVSSQALQIEFLNVWRNADLYPQGDPLAPANVPFEYAFAVTMMAQPLAWFEATGLPEEAFDLGEVLRTYRRHQRAIHEGVIVPIGDEPSGTGWTGFQSLGDECGYVLIFRERSSHEAREMELFEMEGAAVSFEAVLGQGDSFTARPVGGRVHFALPHPFSYALYAYQWH